MNVSWQEMQDFVTKKREDVTFRRCTHECVFKSVWGMCGCVWGIGCSLQTSPAALCYEYGLDDQYSWRVMCEGFP